MDVFTQTQRVRSSLSILQSLRRDVSAYSRDVLPIDRDGIQRMVLVEVCRRNIDDAANATSLLRAMLDGAILAVILHLGLFATRSIPPSSLCVVVSILRYAAPITLMNFSVRSR